MRKISHGTRSCYQTGCRQPECRAAHNAYTRTYNKDRKARKARGLR